MNPYWTAEGMSAVQPYGPFHGLKDFQYRRLRKMHNRGSNVMTAKMVLYGASQLAVVNKNCEGDQTNNNNNNNNNKNNNKNRSGDRD
jgi:hypothetical protein